MSQGNIVITQLAQLGYADRVAYEGHGQHTESARQFAQQLAPELLKQQNQTVAEVNPSTKGNKLTAEKDGGGNASRDMTRQQREKTEQETEDAPSVSSKPWSGNLLNVKV